MKKQIISGFILLLVISCVNSLIECGKTKIKKSVPLIVKGEPAYHGQFPWLAPLFHSKEGYICGSSIISEWHLLTAAHCVNDRSSEKYHALVGRHDLSDDREFNWKYKNISTIYAHEDFDFNAEVQRSEGDIAILRVTEKIKYNNYVQPACLPDESTNAANRFGMTAGYGKTEIFGNHQDRPSYVTMKSISSWKCGKKGIVYANILSERSFCAGDSTNQSSIPCQGDSGGAFLVHNRFKDQYTILGVVSFAIGRCNPKDFVAFSDVSQYMEWINAKLESDKRLYGDSSDPCENISCGGKGECQIVEGRVECVCLPQYSGTYPHCDSSCATNSNCPDDRACLHSICTDLCLNLNVCIQNAECKMKNHRPTCECMNGYRGSGYSHCNKVQVNPAFQTASFTSAIQHTSAVKSTTHEFRLYNNCPFTMWPGLLGNPGKSTPMNGGFKLDPYTVKTFNVESGWGGRIWARRDCDSSGFCVSGDCGHKIQCNGAGGYSPATFAEFTLDGPDSEDNYDISLIEGYNLPMRITPIDGTFRTVSGGPYDCKPAGCHKDLNPNCPDELTLWHNQWRVACRSPCVQFNTDQYCCRGEYGTAETCIPENWTRDYAAIFKEACPTAYSYAYDDPTSAFTCHGNPATGYTVTFCP